MQKNNTDAEFEFRNSSEWIKYSHAAYLPLEEVRHRLTLRGGAWETKKNFFESSRRVQSIPFHLPTLERNFYYFEADCIKQKLSQIESMGIRLFAKLHDSKTFLTDFIVNAAAEEAITSAIYEGANTTRAKAKQLIAEKRTPINKDEHMVVNNYLAMEWPKKNKDKKLDRSLILGVHEIVTRNTLPDYLVNYSGKFRDDAAYVGDHEGVQHELVEKAIDEAIEASTNNPRFLHPLIRGILLHYFIAYIHPFFDGNGRTARALFYFKAIKNGLNFVELLSISAYLKDSGGKRYTRAFENAVTHGGDVTYFVDFALDSLLRALKIVDMKVEYLLRISELRKSLSLSQYQITLLQRLALNKFVKVTNEGFAKQTERTDEAARLELKELVKLGLLTEGKEGKKQVYLIDGKALRQRVVGEQK